MIPDPLPPTHPEHLPDEIAEPLVRSADWLGAMAELTCSRSGESSCAWYHGTWQYLRVLDLVSSPWWHASFFRKAIARQSADRSDIRVLISGCADFSTYALVQGQVADSAKITVLDLCPTPLMATSWYARRIRAPVPELLISDAVEHKRPGSYDIIVSDSFLPRFQADALGELLQTWCASLAPGGVALTTVRLHETRPDPDRQETERLHRWRQAATDAQSWWPQVSDLPLEQLDSRISAFVANQERHTSLDTSTLRVLFAEVGFNYATISTCSYRDRKFAHIAAYQATA